MGKNLSKELQDEDDELSPTEVRRIRLEKLGMTEENELSQENTDKEKTSFSDLVNRSPSKGSDAETKVNLDEEKVTEKKELVETKVIPKEQEKTPSTEPKVPQIESSQNFRDTLFPKTETNKVPPEIANHPIFQKYGVEMYLVHTLFEDIYQITTQRISSFKNPNLKLLEDLEKDDAISVFTRDNVICVLQKVLESDSYYQANDKLIFLFDVYKRLDENKDALNLLNDEKKKDIKRIIITSVIRYLKAPESLSPSIKKENHNLLFNQNCQLYNSFYTYLTECEYGDLLRDLFKQAEDQDFNDLLTPLLKRIIKNCLESTIESFKKMLGALGVLENICYAENRTLECIVNHPLFLPKGPHVDALKFHKSSLFGACLSLSSFPGETSSPKSFFSGSNLKNLGASLKMLKERIHIPVDCVHRIMEHMMKADQKYKKNILDWFYRVILLNNSKQRTYIENNNLLSTDGWFNNFILLLLKFCQKPLEDINTYPKWISKIDLSYLSQKEIFKDVSLLNKKNNSVNPVQDSKSSFLTELIFLTTHALFLQKRVTTMYEEFLRILIKEKQKNGDQSQRFLDLYAIKIAFDIQLDDPYFVSQVYKLLAFESLVILHLFDVQIQDLEDLPLVFEQTRQLKDEQFSDKPSLPLYWAENISTYSLFFVVINSKMLIKFNAHLEILADFILSVISNNQWLVNPYMKAQYIVFLGTLVPQDDQKFHIRDTNFAFLFKRNPYFEKYLVEGIVTVWVEVEKTGTHAQFYEKFSYRLSCCQIVNYLLNTVFGPGQISYIGNSFDELAKSSYDLYLRFVMFYLNDLIFLLDESFSLVRKIKAHEVEVENGSLNLLSEFEKAQKEDNYKKERGVLRVFCTYINAYYEMGIAIARVSPQFFLSEEIKDKFVMNLNYTLQELNGPNATSMEVQNMQELRFNPKTLLKTVVEFYLTFNDNEVFLKSIVNDERSFKIEFFYATLKTIEKYSLLIYEEVQNFAEFIQRIERKIQEKNDDDAFMAELTDIPDEFFDPIVNEIMKDPVLLPTSRNIVDRVTIMKILLSDESDPFNRMKLTKDMLIPQDDLKKRIEGFFEEKKRNKNKNTDK